jgi:hypothetical protein
MALFFMQVYGTAVIPNTIWHQNNRIAPLTLAQRIKWERQDEECRSMGFPKSPEKDCAGKNTRKPSSARPRKEDFHVAGPCAQARL